jgi:hypothetical protein
MKAARKDVGGTPWQEIRVARLIRPMYAWANMGHPPNFRSLGGPLKSGKQTALPTFQQPLLLECYKSIQTRFRCIWSLYPPTRNLLAARG